LLYPATYNIAVYRNTVAVTGYPGECRLSTRE